MLAKFSHVGKSQRLLNSMKFIGRWQSETKPSTSTEKSQTKLSFTFFFKAASQPASQPANKHLSNGKLGLVLVKLLFVLCLVHAVGLGKK